MKITHVFGWALAVCSAALAAPEGCVALRPKARAFGGLWSSEAQPVRSSALRVLFVDHPDATVTAIVDVAYEGGADNLAWILPLPSAPRIALSSRAVFERLDAATSPLYWVEARVQGTCAEDGEAPPRGFAQLSAGPSAADAERASELSAREVLGPYEYVQLALDPSADDPAQAAADWLRSQGFSLREGDRERLLPYLREGMHLLAVKLRAGSDARSLRPLMLTYEADALRIPIRLSARNAREDSGLWVWIFGPSQAVPENYQALVLNQARLDWMSAPRFPGGTPPAGGGTPSGSYLQRLNNYDALVSEAADEADGRGFVSELALPASQFRDSVWSELDEESYASLSAQSYEDGLDAVLAAARFAGFSGWIEALRGATTLPATLSFAAFAAHPDEYRGVARVDAAEFLKLLDTQVIQPMLDTAALLRDAPYLTRLYSRMSPEEMTSDPSFVYNLDLAQIANVHVAQEQRSCDEGTALGEAPWHVRLPQGGVVFGEGTAWPEGLSALPANLRRVALSSTGGGELLADHSDEIARALREASTDPDVEPLNTPPRTGLSIGQSASPEANDEAGDGEKAAAPTRAAHCALSIDRRPARIGGASWLGLAALLGLGRRARARKREVR